MAALAASLFAIGTYLLLQRKLSRIIVGLALLSHGANVLFVNSGRRGIPPLIGSGDPADFADPMPQALVLTAIVISFGTTALLLALAYRSWLLTSDDEVADDVEDRMVGARGFGDDVEVTDETLLVDEAETREFETREFDTQEFESCGCCSRCPSCCR
jgi:multicomponent Na+:H+ antiporter subunit C